MHSACLPPGCRQVLWKAYPAVCQSSINPLCQLAQLSVRYLVPSSVTNHTPDMGKEENCQQ